MATYKAEWLVTKRQTLVFETDHPITDKVTLNDKADEAYKDEGPDKEELLSSILFMVQDITPPEEHVRANYATWRVKNGCIYFRSSKTAVDYQVLCCANNNKDIEANTYLFIVVELTHEASADKYGKVIGQFVYYTDVYIPTYTKSTNNYISDMIQKYEEERLDVSD